MRKLGYIRRLQIDKMTREQFARLSDVEQKLYWATPLPQERVKAIFEELRERARTKLPENAKPPAAG